MNRRQRTGWRTLLWLGAGLIVMLTSLTWGSGPLAAQPAAATTAAERHALWVHPPDVGRTREAVQAFVERSRRAHIDTIIVLVKGMSGEIYWKSERFPAAVVKGYETFDMLGELTGEAHRHGIKVHAWLVDFVEGVRGPALRAHPEWAQVNPAGGTTATETLGPRRRPYPYVWMCPAQRPGYVDQWLLPMIEEIITSYDVDGIHHDYARYPGDVAPDSFCFCDYCVKGVPRYAMLAYDTRAGERYRVDPRQERIEANWWTDPTMLPAGYAENDRREQADFLLNGRTIPGGPADVRYFFYQYRVAQVDRFVREASELVRRINPKLEISAAVFKNPVQSARFIGQQWHQWNDWVDVYTPMTYRSHFAGSFDAYLDHLQETTKRQLEWTRHGRPLEAGIASTYLYREELQPFDQMSEALGVLGDLEQGQARDVALQQLSDAHQTLQTRLAPLAADRAKALSAAVTAVTTTSQEGQEAAIATASKAIAALRADLPAGFCPPGKLIAAIDAARRARPDGIAIFAAGSLTREKLWPALEKAFARRGERGEGRGERGKDEGENH